jgi:acyl carrier protein phosphodiesterase
LQPYLTKYAGIATDIFFDHFLAKNWEHYSEVPLKIYVDDTYALVQANIKILPEKTAYILNYMQSQNWLYNYQFINGIEKTMNGMARRTQQPLLENSHEYLLKHYEAFEKNFHAFFPMLQEHTSNFISNLS